MRSRSCISIASISAGLFISNGNLSRLVEGKLTSIRHKEKRSIKQRELIIGGEAAASGDYPYFVHYDSPGCGGSVRKNQLHRTWKVSFFHHRVLKSHFFFQL